MDEEILQQKSLKKQEYNQKSLEKGGQIDTQTFLQSCMQKQDWY